MNNQFREFFFSFFFLWKWYTSLKKVRLVGFNFLSLWYWLLWNGLHRPYGVLFSMFFTTCNLKRKSSVHCWNISRKWFFGAPVWIFVKGTLLLEFFFVHTETHKPIFVVNSKRINEKVEIRFYLKLMPLCLLPGNMQMKKEVQSSNTEGKFFVLFLVRTCTFPWNI